MSDEELAALLRQVDQLTPEELTQLRCYLERRPAQHDTRPVGGRTWRDIAGAAQAPLAGEDAQAWVSRTRRDADEMRALPHRDIPGLTS